MKTNRIIGLAFAMMLAIPTSIHAQQLKHVSPEKVGMDSKRLLKADSIIEDAIKQGDKVVKGQIVGFIE